MIKAKLKRARIRIKRVAKYFWKNKVGFFLGSLPMGVVWLGFEFGAGWLWKWAALWALIGGFMAILLLMSHREKKEEKFQDALTTILVFCVTTVAIISVCATFVWAWK